MLYVLNTRTNAIRMSHSSFLLVGCSQNNADGPRLSRTGLVSRLWDCGRSWSQPEVQITTLTRINSSGRVYLSDMVVAPALRCAIPHLYHLVYVNPVYHALGTVWLFKQTPSRQLEKIQQIKSNYVTYQH